MEVPDITSPLIYGVPIFILLIFLELLYSLKHDKKLYAWKDLAASSSMGAGAVVLAVGAKAFSIVLFFAVYELCNPIVDGARMNLMGYEAFGWAWYVWLLCQLGDDFSYYWVHRLNHEVRVLWAAHIVHHSSRHFNLGTGIRNGWVTLFYKPFFYIWLCAIGFHPIMLTTCLAIEALWQLQLHTKYVPRIRFLELFMNMHTHHQVHHSSDIMYLDKNHGGFLNIFDRLFGTYKDLKDREKINYGVLSPPNSYNPVVIVSHEYQKIWQDVKQAKTWKARFMYVFGPPGWSPDGTRKTVRQMQRELEAKAKAQWETTSPENGQTSTSQLAFRANGYHKETKKKVVS